MIVKYNDNRQLITSANYSFQVNERKGRINHSTGKNQSIACCISKTIVERLPEMIKQKCAMLLMLLFHTVCS